MEMGEGKFDPNSTDAVLSGILVELRKINERLDAQDECEKSNSKRITTLETQSSIWKGQATLVSAIVCALWTAGTWVIGILLSNKTH